MSPTVMVVIGVIVLAIVIIGFFLWSVSRRSECPYCGSSLKDCEHYDAHKFGSSDD